MEIGMAFISRDERPQELEMPPGAKLPGSLEILRVWQTGTDVQVTLIPIYEDPAMWGLLLVDLVSHVANACGGDDPIAVQEARERVLAGFHAELNNPTDFPKDITDS